MSEKPHPTSEDAEFGAALREAIGQPAPDHVSRALEEVERQIALEDLVLLLVVTTRETARAFFDVILQLTPDSEPGDAS